MTWALEQDDEIDEHGDQVVHPPRVALGVNAAQAQLSLAEAVALGVQLISLATEGNDRVPMPAPAEPEGNTSYVPPRLAMKLAHVLATRDAGS